MKKFNVSDIGDMSDDDKKDFFNYVDRNYKTRKKSKKIRGKYGNKGCCKNNN